MAGAEDRTVTVGEVESVVGDRRPKPPCSFLVLVVVVVGAAGFLVIGAST